MNLRDLRYLVAVADELHFGRAAEQCNVSQPTLSAQLRKLEDYLGVQLVERGRRQVRLTAIGEEVVRRARTVVHGADDIVAVARHFQDPLSGRLRIGLIPTIGPYLLPWISEPLRRELPRMAIELFEDRTAGLLERIGDGELDVGVLALPVPAPWAQTTALYREPFVAALPREHPLSSRKRIAIADLEGQPVLLLEDGHCLRDQALEVCHRVAARERSDFQATSLETLRHMVAVGAGLTLLPALAIRGDEDEGSSVRVRRFTRPAPERTVGMAWRKGAARAQAIARVAETIRVVMAGVPSVRVTEA